MHLSMIKISTRIKCDNLFVVIVTYWRSMGEHACANELNMDQTMLSVPRQMWADQTDAIGLRMSTDVETQVCTKR